MQNKNKLLEVVLTIVVPTLVLTKLSAPEQLGPLLALIVALAFPVGYGAYELYTARSISVFPVIGLLSTLLTGGFAVLALPAQYLIWKEAGVPLVLGLLVLGSEYSRFPLAEKLLLEGLNMPAIAAAYRATHHGTPRKRLRQAGFFIAGSFFLSAALNYAVASYILTGVPGSAEFTAQIGELTAVSYLVIGLPVTLVFMGILVHLMFALKKDTGLPLEKLLKS